MGSTSSSPGENQTATVAGLEPFPDDFFARHDDGPDAVFYEPVRLVTHIDAAAIAAVGALYAELKIDGEVLDLMSSWISHFVEPPQHLTVLGMNQRELDCNLTATKRVLHDLNERPTLPFADGTFDDVVCCVSVDYLTHPVDVFTDVGRVLRPGGRFVTTFSNRCFPAKAIRGWSTSDDATHMHIVSTYFELSGAFSPATVEVRVQPGLDHDPLYAVWATRS